MFNNLNFQPMTKYVKRPDGRVEMDTMLRPTKTGKISRNRKEGRDDVKITVVKIKSDVPVGQQLKALRRMMRISERVICKRMETPFNGYISHWENGTGPAKNGRPTLERIVEYCRALGAKKIEIELNAR